MSDIRVVCSLCAGSGEATVLHISGNETHPCPECSALEYADLEEQIATLTSERDQLKARAEKAEGDARWFVRETRGPENGPELEDEWDRRAKPYEEKQP